MAVIFTLAVASAKPSILLSREYHGNYAAAPLAALQYDAPIAPELINAPIATHLAHPAASSVAYSLPLANSYSHAYPNAYSHTYPTAYANAYYGNYGDLASYDPIAYGPRQLIG